MLSNDAEGGSIPIIWQTIILRLDFLFSGILDIKAP